MTKNIVMMMMMMMMMIDISDSAFFLVGKSLSSA